MKPAELASLRLQVDPCEIFRNRGWEPDPWQARFLRSTAARRLLLCSRQSGKTEVSAGLAAWTALTQPGKLVLVLSPSLRQSGLFLERVKGLVRTSIDLTLHRISSETKTSLTLSNASQVLSLPCSEERIRGFSPDALLLDEAAAVRDDAFMAASPMLAASKGIAVAMSTPRTEKGWFWSLWTGPEDWERFTVTATDCPRISPAFLAAERRVMGPKIFAREYECRFDGDQTDGFRLISPDLVDGMFV